MTFTKKYTNDGDCYYIASAKCPICGAVTEVRVSASGLFRYNNGDLIQNAFPEVSAAEREVIISGMCPKCQETMFGGWDCEEDEEEEEEMA